MVKLPLFPITVSYPKTLPWEWQWMRFVILFCLVMVFVMLLYQATAPREKPRPPVLLGAFLASAALVA